MRREDVNKSLEAQRARTGYLDQQRRMASYINKNADQMAGDEYKGVRHSVAQNLGQAQKNIASGMGKRGMLYSGERAKQDMGAQGQAAGILGQAKYDLGNKYKDLAFGMEQDALTQSEGAYGQAQAALAQNEQVKQQAMGNRLAYLGQLGQGLGGLAANVHDKWGQTTPNPRTNQMYSIGVLPTMSYNSPTFGRIGKP